MPHGQRSEAAYWLPGGDRAARTYARDQCRTRVLGKARAGHHATRNRDDILDRAADFDAEFGAEFGAEFQCSIAQKNGITVFTVLLFRSADNNVPINQALQLQQQFPRSVNLFNIIGATNKRLGNKIDIGVGYVISPDTYTEIVDFAKFFKLCCFHFIYYFTK